MPVQLRRASTACNNNAPLIATPAFMMPSHDAGTARQAIVFADEYLHINEVVHACNALGLYQVCPSSQDDNYWARVCAW